MAYNIWACIWFLHMLYLLDYHHLYNGNILPALSNSCNFTTLPSLSPSISRLPESGLFLFRIGLLCLVSVQLTGGICPARSLRAQRQMVHPAGVLAQPLFSRVIQPWPRKYSRKRNPNGLPAVHTMLREGCVAFKILLRMSEYELI